MTDQMFLARYRDSEGKTVSVPLDQIEVVRDGLIVARFRQNGYFAVAGFVDAMPAFITDDDVTDLGKA